MYNTETKQSYSDLLRGSFKALGHFADEALRASSELEFFKILCENIVPLITKSEAFEPLYLEWIKEKGIFKKEYERAEKNAIKEIISTFTKLKSSLDIKNLLENPVINKAVSSIEDVLEFREVFAMPPYYEIAYDRLKELCYRLLELGYVDLVREFGEIINIEESHSDPQTHGIITTQKPYFHYFTFVPSRSKLCELNKIFSWDGVSNPWVIWEYITLAEWCWQQPLSYFEGQELEYEDPDSSAQSRFQLNLHSFCYEMNTITNGSYSKENASFFELSRFKKYLKTLLNTILLHQEIHGTVDFTALRLSPHSIELCLDDNKLLLDVEWIEGGLIDTYFIHKFTEDSTLKQFTYDLISSTPATIISIEEYDASGLSIPKYLKRTKLDGMFSDVFFINKSTYKMELRSKRVLLADIPKVDLLKLREHIKGLKKTSAGWLVNDVQKVRSAS